MHLHLGLQCKIGVGEDNRVHSGTDTRREQGEQDEEVENLFPYRLPALRIKYSIVQYSMVFEKNICKIVYVCKMRENV